MVLVRTIHVFIKLIPAVLALRKDRTLWISQEGKNIDEKRFRRNAQRLLNTCISLGPVFIKFGQWLSSRADILPQPYLEELSKLQDSVPAVSFEKVRPIIEKDIGKIEEKFDEHMNHSYKYHGLTPLVFLKQRMMHNLSPKKQSSQKRLIILKKSLMSWIKTHCLEHHLVKCI